MALRETRGSMTDLEQVIINSPRLRPRTKEIYLASVREFLAFCQGPPTGPVVEIWRDVLITTRSPQTVNQKLSGLRYASRRVAERAQDPRLDWARYAELLKPDRYDKPRRALTVDEATTLIDACRGTRPFDLRDTAIMVLGFRTGLRRAGIVGITLGDVSPVRPGLDGANISSTTVTLKGGRRHTLNLDAETTDTVGVWRQWLYTSRIKKGSLFRSLRHNTIGKGLTSSGLYKAMRRRAKRAGIDDFHPHIFRHSFVSWAQAAGIPPYRIAAMTGHRSDGMIQRYTDDLDPEPIGSLLPKLIR